MKKIVRITAVLLLFACSLAALVLWLQVVQPRLQRYHTAQQIDSQTAVVTMAFYDHYDSPDWLDRWLGLESSDLKQLHLEGLFQREVVSKELLEHVCALPQLEDLELNNVTIEPGSPFPRINRLTVRNLDPASLDWVIDLIQSQDGLGAILITDIPEFDDAYLARVYNSMKESDFSGWLWLNRVNVTGTGLKGSWSPTSNNIKVVFIDCPINDSGLKVLANSTEISSLGLNLREFERNKMPDLSILLTAPKELSLKIMTDVSHVDSELQNTFDRLIKHFDYSPEINSFSINSSHFYFY